MGKKEEYKLQNEQFLEQLRAEEGIQELPCGILYRVVEEGTGGPTLVSTVLCLFITKVRSSMGVSLIIPGNGIVRKLFD